MRMIVASLIVGFVAAVAPAHAVTRPGNLCTLRAGPDSAPDKVDLDTQFTLPQICRPR